MKGTNRMLYDVPFRKGTIHQNLNNHSQLMLKTLQFSPVKRPVASSCSPYSTWKLYIIFLMPDGHENETQWGEFRVNAIVKTLAFVYFRVKVEHICSALVRNAADCSTWTFLFLASRDNLHFTDENNWIENKKQFKEQLLCKTDCWRVGGGVG